MYCLEFDERGYRYRVFPDGSGFRTKGHRRQESLGLTPTQGRMLFEILGAPKGISVEALARCLGPSDRRFGDPYDLVARHVNGLREALQTPRLIRVEDFLCSLREGVAVRKVAYDDSPPDTQSDPKDTVGEEGVQVRLPIRVPATWMTNEARRDGRSVDLEEIVAMRTDGAYWPIGYSTGRFDETTRDHFMHHLLDATYGRSLGFELFDWAEMENPGEVRLHTDQRTGETAFADGDGEIKLIVGPSGAGVRLAWEPGSERRDSPPHAGPLMSFEVDGSTYSTEDGTSFRKHLPRNRSKLIYLTPKQAALLMFLVHAGDAVTDEDRIRKAVWPAKEPADVSSNLIRKTVQGVRDAFASRTIIERGSNQGEYLVPARVTFNLDSHPGPLDSVDLDFVVAEGFAVRGPVQLVERTVSLVVGYRASDEASVELGFAESINTHSITQLLEPASGRFELLREWAGLPGGKAKLYLADERWFLGVPPADTLLAIVLSDHARVRVAWTPRSMFNPNSLFAVFVGPLLLEQGLQMAPTDNLDIWALWRLGPDDDRTRNLLKRRFDELKRMG